MAILDLKDRKLRAVNDKVVVLRAGRPRQTAGGIHLPAETDKVYNEGEVLSVGPDVKSCKAGDVIVWAVFKGQAAGHHDEQRWIIADAEVLAVVEPDAPERPRL
jgi:co-chaperonin GroES (HSP10)